LWWTLTGKYQGKSRAISQRLSAYVRVMQNPSPRWTADDQKRSQGAAGFGMYVCAPRTRRPRLVEL
jgi:hypothetical protein